MCQLPIWHQFPILQLPRDDWNVWKIYIHIGKLSRDWQPLPGRSSPPLWIGHFTADRKLPSSTLGSLHLGHEQVNNQLERNCGMRADDPRRELQVDGERIINNICFSSDQAAFVTSCTELSVLRLLPRNIENELQLQLGHLCSNRTCICS
jgi:hypothetical protein